MTSSPVTFIERRSIVALYHEPPPSGTVDAQLREVVVAEAAAEVLPQDLKAHVANIAAGLPRGSLQEPSPLARAAGVRS